jgi:chromosome segregation ATPase
MSPQPSESRRDWEHWPGRRASDERLRRSRLRSLFTPSDDQDAIEAMIAEKGLELEAQTEQLRATIADLEQREERARQLQAAVEAMLRHGSRELDDRHAELNSLAQELAQREDALSRAELEIAERRREAGAVELRRAAAERREAALLEREEALERIAAELAERERRHQAGEPDGGDSGEREAALAARERDLRSLEERLATQAATLRQIEAELYAREKRLEEATAEADRMRASLAAEHAALLERRRRIEALEHAERAYGEPSDMPPDEREALVSEHLLFVSGLRYRIVAASGPAPRPGATVDVDGEPHRVLRVGVSPLPDDARRCAYVQPAPD